MIELKELRTSHAKTFDMGGGRRQIRASFLQKHIEKNGKFEDVDTTIKNGKIRDGIYHADILKKSIGFKSIDRKTGNGLTVEVAGAKYFEPEINGNSAIWKDAFPGVDIKLVFGLTGVRIYRILNNNSAEKSCVWKVTEDNGDKEIYFKPNFFGFDANGLETKHDVQVSEKVNGSYTVTDNFSGKVVVRQGKKRIKEELDAVYPVIIDPTVDVFVNAEADDGAATKIVATWTSGTLKVFNNAQDYVAVTKSANPTSQYVTRSFVRFNGITIPMGSTINSANIVLDIQSNSGGPNPYKVIAKKLNNPAAPTNYTAVFSPATVATNNATGSISATGTNNIDVADIAQELVNEFDYSNESMAFILSLLNTTLETSAGQRAFNFNGYGGGGSGNVAELVIDYTATVSFIPRLTLLGVG